MALLILFSFLGGIVTILSPCILPILPIVLSSGLSGGKRRPLGVVAGFVLSFTFFTVALSSLVKLTGVSAESLRSVAALTVLLFGLVLLVPPLQHWWERFAAGLSSGFLSKNRRSERHGFFGGFIIGLSLGLVWAPCVGPIMASVITLAASGSVSGSSILVAFSYALGTAIPLFFLIYGGRRALSVMPALRERSQKIQQVFGLLMLLTAVAIFFSWDRAFQAFILDLFPNYGSFVTFFEQSGAVRDRLPLLRE